jgi:hypothetical protein
MVSSWIFYLFSNFFLNYRTLYFYTVGHLCFDIHNMYL